MQKRQNGFAVPGLYQMSLSIKAKRRLICDSKACAEYDQPQPKIPFQQNKNAAIAGPSENDHLGAMPAQQGLHTLQSRPKPPLSQVARGDGIPHADQGQIAHGSSGDMWAGGPQITQTAASASATWVPRMGRQCTRARFQMFAMNMLGADGAAQPAVSDPRYKAVQRIHMLTRPPVSSLRRSCAPPA